MSGRCEVSMSSEKCCPECVGWGVFETGAGTLEIQRCDDCSTFPNDWAALIEALKATEGETLSEDLHREVMIAAIGDIHMSLGKCREEIREIQEAH